MVIFHWPTAVMDSVNSCVHAGWRVSMCVTWLIPYVSSQWNISSQVGY